MFEIRCIHCIHGFAKSSLAGRPFSWLEAAVWNSEQTDPSSSSSSSEHLRLRMDPDAPAFCPAGTAFQATGSAWDREARKSGSQLHCRVGDKALFKRIQLFHPLKVHASRNLPKRGSKMI